MSERATRDYPLDCWYVAATADDIGAELTGLRMLGRQLVFYRASDGAVAALDDRCAHCALPLSMGRLVDDGVVCRYDGFTYDRSGACVVVPSQEHVPYGAAVPSHPVREQGRVVWVWLGNPRRAGHLPPPGTPWLADADWSVFGGSRTVAAGYLLLHDNALDRTHFPFVHPDTSHRGYLEGPPPLEIEVTETSVSYARHFPAAPPTSWQATATGLAPDASCVQHESGVFVSPALHVDHMRIEADSRAFRTTFVRAFTPIEPGATRALWWVARDYALGDRLVDETLRRVHERTMEEDEPLLEAIQASLDRDGDVRRVSVAADAAAVRARQLVRRMLDEERPPRLT